MKHEAALERLVTALERILRLEARIVAIVDAMRRVERIYDDGGLQEAIDNAERELRK